MGEESSTSLSSGAWFPKRWRRRSQQRRRHTRLQRLQPRWAPSVGCSPPLKVACRWGGTAGTRFKWAAAGLSASAGGTRPGPSAPNTHTHKCWSPTHYPPCSHPATQPHTHRMTCLGRRPWPAAGRRGGTAGPTRGTHLPAQTARSTPRPAASAPPPPQCPAQGARRLVRVGRQWGMGAVCEQCGSPDGRPTHTHLALW